MEQILQKLQELGLDTGMGITYTGTPEKYIAAIARYVRSCEENTANIKDQLSSGNLQRYTISVHAVKSNSKMIGHTELFKAFESLEAAGKNNDTAFIEANNDAVLKRYAEVAGQLRPFTEEPPEAAAPAISLSEAEDITEKLLGALDDFDDELSAELAAKLSGYPFEEAEKEKLGKARKYIGDFMYDEAAELIKELKKSIE
ncbi:MAG: hypothetical protein J6X60_05410 [Ruminiclostridium sp.]|nr:hypothetical protein [Ruminiclostridium sp.]